MILLGLQISVVAQDGGVSIGKGNSDADPSALLELVSTNKGLLIPRLSSSEREGISSPANGLIVYDTTKSSIYYWDGAAWKPVSGKNITSGTTFPIDANDNDLFFNTDSKLLYVKVMGNWTSAGAKKQILELNSTKLKLLEEGAASGSEVDLSGLLQNLSFVGTKLTISNGNTVDLSTLSGNKQTLSLSGKILTISGGNSVDFTSLVQGIAASEVKVNPTSELISTNVQSALEELQGEILTKGNGNMLQSIYDINANGQVDNADKINGFSVDASVPSGAVFTDNQQLSISGNTILLSGQTYSSITLPTSVTGGDMVRSVYDTNTDNVVDQAATVSAGGVTTTALSGAPGVGTNGQVLSSNGTGGFAWINAGSGSGTVTAVSVASANGFTGTSSGGATPALTLGTSVTGLLKGNGTGVATAVAGTDYQAPITNSLTLGSGSNAVTLKAPTSNVGAYNLTLPTTAGTPDYVLKTDGSGVLRWDVDATGAAGGGITSIGLSLPLYNSFTTLTADGSFTGALTSQTANTVLAGPGSGANAAPAFRSLVANDIPSLDWAKITTGKPTTLAGYGITDAAASSHTHTFASLTSKPTTLSGYGITDALSNPMSASGDIIYGGASGAATRLAKGTDGQVLTLASGVPTWAAPAGGSGGDLNITTEQTGNYTATTTDDIIMTKITVAGITLSLPSSGVPIGKTYHVCNLGTQPLNLNPVPIEGTRSVVNGAESVTLMCVGDGLYITTGGLY